MGIISKLLKIARAVVQNVRNIIRSQEKLVEEIIYNRIKQMVSEVLAGAWKGDGATRFAEEMNTEVLPSLANLNLSFGHHHDAISKAEEVLFRADATAARMVAQLMDVYRSIYT